jgi:hypothetical protein
MNKADQEFFDKWKKDGLAELKRQRAIPKVTKKQQDAWDKIMKEAK